MNLMQQGAAWLGEALKDAAGVPVTLEQGLNVLELTAWVAKQGIKLDGHEDFVTKYRFRDWAFVSADLEGIEVRNGSLITDVESGDIYEVLPMTDGGKGKSNRNAEEEDPFSILTVVHTKLISNA